MYGKKAIFPKKPEEFPLNQNNLVDEQFASIEKNIKVDFKKIFKAKKPINLILTATKFQSTVKPMFQNLLGKEAKVTLNGLTGIADELQAIIFDEAIPLNKRYLDDEYKTEEEKFSDVINVVTRNANDKPIYFLCNPNAKGA
ncbi:11268_t:CDS:2 [Funneliformis geosporum]|uniref:11268_t:CDS:1 n=1 Tax=Funneliformis geosporum TaxID=1117311 RepID=A0A9W4SZ27_9GLOM|nr:11268_t:CDS:2 [Funneliformis geosporum]